MAGTRDLVWLIASLAVVVAPHAARAPWWLTLLTLCLYGWRVYFALNRAPLPSRWLLMGVLAVAMLAIWGENRSLFGRQAGILLLMLFSGMKLLETRSHRDCAVAAFLGFFLIMTNFLYTQSIPTALAMGAGSGDGAALGVPAGPAGHPRRPGARPAAPALRQRGLPRGWAFAADPGQGGQ